MGPQGREVGVLQKEKLGGIEVKAYNGHRSSRGGENRGVFDSFRCRINKS